MTATANLRLRAEKEEPAAGLASRRCWLPACALIILAAVVFLPILEFEFVNVDVGGQILDNPYIRQVSWANLRKILTEPCVTSYYPVRTLTYLVDCQIWGPDPKGFKLTNGLIHLANIALVYLLLLRLVRFPSRIGNGATSHSDVVAAAFGASLFAFHPVVVEPVAWVPGREELLMTLGGLACFHAHLSANSRASEQTAGRAWTMDLAAALACAAACLSNAAGAVIPLIVTAWDVLAPPRPTWKRIAAGVLPLWILGGATIVLKLWSDSHNDYLVDVPLPLWRDALAVPKTFWLNVETLAWPTGLTIDYWDDIPEGVWDLGVALGAAAFAGLVAACWLLRRQKRELFGVAWFLLALAPSSQIMPHHILRADRFLYLPLVGIAALASFGLRRTLGDRVGRARLLRIGLAAFLIAGLTALTSRQLQTWRDGVSVWEQCLKVCPTNGVGYGHLADAWAEKGEFERARPLFEQALRLDPGNPQTMQGYAYWLAMCRREELRDYDRAIELATRACQIVGWRIPEYRRVLSMAHMNRATAFSHAGQYQAAIVGYRAAIEADAKYAAPVFNLAVLLVSCPDERVRDPAQAVRLAEQAVKAEGDKVLPLTILAQVYEQAGCSDLAAGALEKAILAADEDGDPTFREALAARLSRLRANLSGNPPAHPPEHGK